ncbi:MAG: sugar phosphate isomerase/epimerase [Tannerellaceae bacterium]|jgi:sugar phosphate isomerase/epimerase|nr:sugar phosphate isomerase/epimerase [Tannerellaceae bacterium]
MTTNRRTFLRNASLFTLGGLLAGKTSRAAAIHPAITKTNAKQLGLQIYSLGRELYPDAAGGLKKVAQMGYTTIELAGYSADGTIGGGPSAPGIPLAEFKKYAVDAGLTITSSHLNPPVRGPYSSENLQGIKDFWKKAADDHAAIGVKYIIQPGQPSTRSVEEVAYVGEVFNEAGRIAKAAGLVWGYHNHSGEFARVVPGGTEPITGRVGRNAPEGIQIIYDAMLANTDPSLVIFELDVYWAVMGQQDPVAYMKKYADRIRALHIKDIAVLGESGMMNFQKIFETAYTNGIQDWYVELEGYRGGTQFEGVKGCADYLLKAPFVK